MAAYTFGKPVVASNINGLSEYVKDGDTGLLIPPADVEQLAQAIIKLLSDNDLRQHMGKNARRWVEEWQEKINQKTLVAYDKAISLHTNGKKETSREF
jgi:glycosyltransferase involved in cell wall biosynthesis